MISFLLGLNSLKTLVFGGNTDSSCFWKANFELSGIIVIIISHFYVGFDNITTIIFGNWCFSRFKRAKFESIALSAI